MSIVIWPAQPAPWVESIRGVAGNTEVVVPASEDEALAAAASAEGWIGKLNPTLLKAAPKLRWLHAWNTGMEKIIFPELAAAKNVTATNMRHIFDDHVANFILFLFLSMCRDLPRLLRKQFRNEWTPMVPVADSSMTAAHVSMRPAVETRDPGDMTVLIQGLGGIGAEVARRISVLGPTVIGIDPKVTDSPGVTEFAKPDRLNDLIGRADTVIVCAPQTPETIGMFDDAMFKRMKKGAYFINLGRGEMVDQRALERALASKHLGGAGLDVFEKEPLPADSPLWDAENVIITPHIGGWGGPHTDERELATAMENVRRFIGGRPLINVVDKAVWY